MCGIVAKALHSAPNSPALFSAQATGAPLPRIQRLGRPADNGPEILWRDDNFTVYRERANPISSKGHLIIVFKCVLFPIHSFVRCIDGRFICL